VLTDNPFILQSLIQNGAKVNQRNQKGMTPLAVAASKGKNTSIEIFVKNGADINQPQGTRKKKQTALQIARSRHHMQTERLLLSLGAKDSDK